MMVDEVKDLKRLLRRIVDVLHAAAETKDPDERQELIVEYHKLLLEIPDEEPTVAELTRDVLWNAAHDLDMYDRRGGDGFYNDDETVLRHVVSALSAIVNETLGTGAPTGVSQASGSGQVGERAHLAAISWDGEGGDTNRFRTREWGMEAIWFLNLLGREPNPVLLESLRGMIEGAQFLARDITYDSDANRVSFVFMRPPAPAFDSCSHANGASILM